MPAADKIGEPRRPKDRLQLCAIDVRGRVYDFLAVASHANRPIQVLISIDGLSFGRGVGD
jgi:hypothetical protein